MLEGLTYKCLLLKGSVRCMVQTKNIIFIFIFPKLNFFCTVMVCLETTTMVLGQLNYTDIFYCFKPWRFGSGFEQKVRNRIQKNGHILRIRIRICHIANQPTVSRKFWKFKKSNTASIVNKQYLYTFYMYVNVLILYEKCVCNNNNKYSNISVTILLV